MTNNLRKFASVLLMIALTSLFCIILYTYNNKYTHNNLQPYKGQLTVSEESLNTFHYLIHDWAFYPDVLLTPDKISGHIADETGIYTDIGTYTRFDSLGTRENPHGSGSYALELFLPSDSRTYALELPEIFSSYRLYINGEEYLHVGTPEPDAYEARTQTKLVTFRAKEYATLLIAVSDYSHYYSGLVYPPVFGEADTVIQLHDLRQSITLIAAALGLILTFATLYLGITLRKPNAVLFALLSFSLCISVLVPYLHVLFELPVFPWYMLELVCIYTMPLLIIILHNRICEVHPKCHFISVGCMSVFCVLACGYAYDAAELTVPVMQLFSRLIFIYKISTAAYLLCTAYQHSSSGEKMILPIYYASIAYAVIFFWDRILPVYEPMFFGWFMDWGNLMLVIAIGMSLLDDMITSQTRSLAFAEEHRQMTKQLAMQREYSRQLSEQTEKNRRMIHDFRHHLRVIQAFSERIRSSDETSAIHQELHSYLTNVSESPSVIPSDRIESFSENASVDALLRYYYAYARQKNILTEFYLMPASLTLSDIEYCTLLGNLLENAIEACDHLPDTVTKRVQLHTRETGHLLFLRIENSYDGYFVQEKQVFLTRKPQVSAHGIGMASVRDIVVRHNGTMDVYPLKDVFRIGISLPLKNK